MSRASSPCVLVVEDDMDTAFLICRQVRKMVPDCTIHHAPEGEEAVRWLRRYPQPDLLVTDLQMPGLDGFGLIEWVRNNLRESIPIMVHSASADSQSQNRCAQLQVNAFVPKDGSFLDFCVNFQSLLGLGETLSPNLERDGHLRYQSHAA